MRAVNYIAAGGMHSIKDKCDFSLIFYCLFIYRVYTAYIPIERV